MRSGNADTVNFQRFDKSEIDVYAFSELPTAFIVLGLTDTPLDRHFTIRMPAEQELYDIQKYADAHTPISNLCDWADSAGKFKIKAELVSVDGGNVTLKKEDGTEVKVQLAKLSKADRDWVKENREVD